VVEHETEMVVVILKFHIGIVIKLHMAASIMSNDWWYDSGANIHICNNKNHFKDYEVVEDGKEVLMGNYNVAKVMGKWSVKLNFTSRKKLLLVNVLYIPNIRKNLVFVNLLHKKGFKVV